MVLLVCTAPLSGGGVSVARGCRMGSAGGLLRKKWPHACMALREVGCIRVDEERHVRAGVADGGFRMHGKVVQ
jgi:hypothetical protein